MDAVFITYMLVCTKNNSLFNCVHTKIAYT